MATFRDSAAQTTALEEAVINLVAEEEQARLLPEGMAEMDAKQQFQER